MSNKQIISFTMVLLVFLSIDFHIEACSRVFWSNKINKATARTTDLYIDDRPAFVISPRGIERDGGIGENSIKWTSKYGSVAITAFGGKVTTEGMNEKGLSGHLLYLQDSEYEESDSRKSLSNLLWVQYMIDNCASVKEAIESLENVHIGSVATEGREWPIHACLEDASGDSAIIEFVKKKLVIHHGSQFTVMTNEPPYDVQIKNLQRYKYFGGTLPLPGDIDSLSRFVRCSAFLKTLPEPSDIRESIGYLLGVIRTAQVPFGAEDTSSSLTEDTWATRWTSVTDMTNLKYYFNSTSTPNIVWIDYKNIDFSNKQSAKNIVLQNPVLVGDISK